MANEELRPQRVMAQGQRTARPSAEAAVVQMQAMRAELAAKAAAEAKLQADLRASLTADEKQKSGILGRLLGR